MLVFPHMIYDIPPTIIKEKTVEIRFIEEAKRNFTSNQFPIQQNTEGFDGIIVQSGTAPTASGVSNASIAAPYNMNSVASGPVIIYFNIPSPEHELKIQYLGGIMELSAEISEKK